MSIIGNKNYLSIAVTALLSGTVAHAQSTEDAIARCASIAAAEARIECLESALRQPDAADPVKISVAETDTTDTNSAEKMPDAANSEVSAEPGGENVAIEAATPTTAVVVPDGSESESLPTVQESSADEVPDEVELGAEQITEPKIPKNTRISATVVNHQLVGSGRLRFTLENGQIWQQTGDDDAGINRKLRNYETVQAEMWQSRSGGYRLYLTPIDRTVRVRRLK